ncbi:DUF2635 domain-containing protein [Paraburkholderia terrae]|uniref:DUF2635 domain-containing protein n=1 Tax=Paraburkholderia terrae TaxID=311230 RepID=UPI00296AD38B|nr:DUF2635 domain-containing protein [Paraburkholderia terrae]MDW3655467.1 DUF2635 domain-containing protein [Paraburkholderia terrae]
MKVFPAPGLLVRDPVTKTHVPADEGLDVPDGDLFWNRLLRDGDVTLTPPDVTPEVIKHAAAADEEEQS